MFLDFFVAENIDYIKCKTLPHKNGTMSPTVNRIKPQKTKTKTGVQSGIGLVPLPNASKSWRCNHTMWVFLIYLQNLVDAVACEVKALNRILVKPNNPWPLPNYQCTHHFSPSPSKAFIIAAYSLHTAWCIHISHHTTHLKYTAHTGLFRYTKAEFVTTHGPTSLADIRLCQWITMRAEAQTLALPLERWDCL